MTLTSNHAPVILIAEDDRNDQFFLRSAFDAAEQEVELYFVPTAEDAIAVLENNFRPNLVITDLNMPGVGGFSLINFIKRNRDLKVIPVVVFSGSDDDADVSCAYEFSANSYVAKPNNVEGYERFAQAFSSFWLSQAKLAA